MGRKRFPLQLSAVSLRVQPHRRRRRRCLSSRNMAGSDAASFLIFADEVKHFMGDTDRDLIWLLRAAHHLPQGQRLTGQEPLPPESDDPGRLAHVLRLVRDQREFAESDFLPKPKTGPEYYPLLYVLKADADASGCEATLNKLCQLRFSRGGLFTVLRIPAEPWTRQVRDEHPKDTWAWGTLMPLYFREVGDREPHWQVQYFQMGWQGRDNPYLQALVDDATVSKQWHSDNGKLFARHVGVALVYPNGNDSVLLLTVFQHNPRNNKEAWSIPGGNVDRGVDEDWTGAAFREFEEEVNPSESAQWRASQAFEANMFQRVSIQNLLPSSRIQNMSRPSLNFVVARATPTFYSMTQDAPPPGRTADPSSRRFRH